MAYALLTEGMSLEHRAAFDLVLNAGPDASPAAARAAVPSVAAQNREALRSWAGLGVPVPVVE